MTPTATIFEVKRFAVHDGPGVRTTLFLKGCPLRCRWCHNPEGMEARPQLAYHAHKCRHCGECVKACPRGAHNMLDGKHVFLREKCGACGACAEACQARALKLFGRRFTVAEALGIALEDKDFYRDGGGVTLSGGEPLLQAGFCAELCRRLKQEGVHCAIDTSGAAPWASFEQVLPWTDLFLYDVKHLDDRRHQELTGASNRQILDNLKRLSACDIPIEIRLPVVPGLNDDAASVAAIGEFLGGLPNLAGVRLLPYHPARSKHEALGRPDPMPGMAEPSPQRMDAIAAQLPPGMA